MGENTIYTAFPEQHAIALKEHLAIRLIEQGLTSHQTHCRSYRGRILQIIWPNQQCQSTEWSQLVFQI